METWQPLTVKFWTWEATQKWFITTRLMVEQTLVYILL